MIKKSIAMVKRNPIHYFCFKLTLLIAMVFILDYSIGNLLEYFYFKQKIGTTYRTTYSIEKTTADVLIFGSSRATHHYKPELFEKRLNLSYYNVGRDGHYMFYHSALLKAVLKRYSPKMIILDLKGGEFEPDQESYDRLSSLLPYYRRHPEMQPIIELKSKYEKFKMLSKIYPYNSLMVSIAIGNTEFHKQRDRDTLGYIPISKIWGDSIKTGSTSIVNNIDNNKLMAYETFIQECVHANIKLYIVCSPYFIRFNDPDHSLRVGQKMAQKYNITFLDYSNDSVFIHNAQLFADISHLNESGAMVFSNILLDDIAGGPDYKKSFVYTKTDWPFNAELYIEPKR